MPIFVYVPGFYAAVEQADHANLRGRPVLVGGDPSKRGIVLGASAEARAAGVSEGMDIQTALARCPLAELRSTRLRRYREVSALLLVTARTASDRIERFGLDALYVDSPEGRAPLEVAAEICVRVGAELALPARAGVAPARFAAYLAAREAGPSGLREVREEDLARFLAPCALSDLWGLGPATADKLAERDIRTIGELRARSLAELESIVGRVASSFLALASGLDRSPIRRLPPVKSLSRELTLDQPSVDLVTLRRWLGELAGDLEQLLARERRSARTLMLGVRYVDGEETTRTLTVGEPLLSRSELEAQALELLSRTQAGVRQVRRLRLQASRLERTPAEGEGRQLRLF